MSHHASNGSGLTRRCFRFSLFAFTQIQAGLGSVVLDLLVARQFRVDDPGDDIPGLAIVELQVQVTWPADAAKSEWLPRVTMFDHGSPDESGAT